MLFVGLQRVCIGGPPTLGRQHYQPVHKRMQLLIRPAQAHDAAVRVPGKDLSMDSRTAAHTWIPVVLLLALHGGAETPENQSAPHDSDSVYFAEGDAIGITVRTDTTQFLNGIYPVDNEGYVYLPIVGPLHVTSRSPHDLRRFLDSAFVKYLPYPDIQVRRLVRLSLVGGFNQPGLYYVDPELSLWDALREAGGPVRDDGFRKLRWYRGAKRMREDLIPVLQAGSTLDEAGIRSGDHITVRHRLRRSGWEVFTDDVAPLISLLITSASTTVALIYLINED